MSKAKEVKEVIANVNEENKENEKMENMKVMEEKEVEEKEVIKEEIPTETKEEKQARIKDELEKKLRTFPRSLTIADLIHYRSLGCETWLNAQRMPSHTPNKALEIIDSALQGIPCGVISLGLNTDDNSISTINGSSRIDDFIRFTHGIIGRKENGFKDLTKEARTNFLRHELTIDWLQGTEKELIRDFKNLNNDVALTGGQKAFTNLVGSNAIDIVNKLNSHTIFEKKFSARQLQKQEQNNCIFLVLSNILGCYNAKIDKVTSDLAEKDMTTIDIEKLIYIFDKIESADVELNKFKFVHLVHLMYIGDCWKSKTLHFAFDIDMIDDTAIGNAVSVNYATSGTNSNDMNNERIQKMAKKLYLHFTTTAAQSTVSAPMLNPNDL